MKTLDELRGYVEDVLTIASLSDTQTMVALSSRANGASFEQLLLAALSVAREQTNQKIAEFEHALDASEQERWALEDELQELRERIESLERERRTKRKSTPASAVPAK